MPLHKLILSSPFILLLIIATSSLYAETLFMKDLTRMEGTIQKEDAVKVTLRLADGTIKTFSRKEISRVVYSNDWKQIKYFYKKDLSYSSGHLVDENRDQYVIRPGLDSNNEVTIKKNDIKFVAQQDVKICGTISSGEDKRVLPLVDSFYINFGIYLDPHEVMGGFLAGIENTYSSFFHLGLTASFTGIQSGYKLTGGSGRYEFNDIGSIIATGGINYLYDNHIGAQLYAGIGYGLVATSAGEKNEIIYKTGFKIPLRIYSYRFVYLFFEDMIFPDPDKKYINLLTAGFCVSL